MSLTAAGYINLATDKISSSGSQTLKAGSGVVYLGKESDSNEAGETSSEPALWQASKILLDDTDLFLDFASELQIRTGSSRRAVIYDDFSCRNLYFYSGELDISSQKILINEDFAAWGENYDPCDYNWDTGSAENPKNAENTRFAWYGESFVEAESSRKTEAYLRENKKSARFKDSGLEGTVLSVLGNFYANGIDFTSGNFSLRLPDSSKSNPVFNNTSAVTEKQWGIPYAVAFNLSVAGSTVSCTSENASAWVSAASPFEATDGSIIHYGHKVTNAATEESPNSGWQFDTLHIVSAETVFDDVIHIKFSAPVENSNNEINTVLNALKTADTGNSEIGITYGGMWYDDGTLPYQFINGVTAWEDADCTKPLAASSGDVDHFYIRTGDAAGDGSWNTDATGKSAGVTSCDPLSLDSSKYTTRSTNRLGMEKNIVPNLSFVEGLLYMAEGKTFCRNYGINGQLLYDEVEDECSPVLVGVYIGQELHDDASEQTPSAPESQNPYDSHNFIEFRYSEPVDIAGISDDAENVKAVDSLGATTSSGGTGAGSGISFAGFASVGGRLVTGSAETSEDALPSMKEDGTVHALYRKFALKSSQGSVTSEKPEQAHRIRISIAGYSEGEASANGKILRSWNGYIDEAEVPSGAVTRASNELIKDRSVRSNPEKSVNILDAVGTPANHPLPVLIVSRGDITVAAVGHSVTTDNPTDEAAYAGTLYGGWDVSAPETARFYTKGEYADGSSLNNTPLSEYEVLPVDTDGDGNIDALEVHFFDNANNPLNVPFWISKFGWSKKDVSGDDLDYDLWTNSNWSKSSAPDIAGGSRSLTNARGTGTNKAGDNTTGGLRFSTVLGSQNAFSYQTALSTGETSSSEKAFTGRFGQYASLASIFEPDTPVEKRMKATDADRLYLHLEIPSDIEKYTVSQRFALSYDADKGFVTDLAGNRMKSAEKLLSPDKTPPDFSLTVAAVEKDEIYILFNKKLSQGVKRTDDYAQIWANALQLVKKSDVPVSKNDDIEHPSWIYATDLIDHTVPARICVDTDYATGFILKLTQAVDLNILTDYQLIAAKNAEDWGPDRDSPVENYISKIQDDSVNNNPLPITSKHVPSDFAVNLVEPLYVYDNKGSLDYDGMYFEGEYSVRNWDGTDGNSGRLLAERDLTIQSAVHLPDGITEEDFSPKPDIELVVQNSSNLKGAVVSDQYNKNTDETSRVWLPTELKALSSESQRVSENQYLDGQYVTEKFTENNLMNFTIPNDPSNPASLDWKENSELQFLFVLKDKDGKDFMIDNDLDGSNVEEGGTADVPFYALRLRDEEDITSIDLWSFTLARLKQQRGGVTILNNVINSSVREQTTVEVNVAETGSLTVQILTLDGDVVKTLQRGRVEPGLYYYRWNGTTAKGDSVARGMYFVRVVGPGIDETRKVMVVKD